MAERRPSYAGRQTTPDICTTALALEFKGAAEGAHAFVHSGQSPAKCLIRRKSDAIVGDLDRYLQAFDGSLHLHRTRVGVPKHVGHGFLDDPINCLGKQAVNVVQPGIDTGCQPEVRRL